jgi:hypothetical protein
VTCFANEDCDSLFPSDVTQEVTQKACCCNMMDPVGFSYQGNDETCWRCPIG